MFRTLVAFALVASLSQFARADGPKDNLADDVRRIPKLGVEVPPEMQKELEQGLAQLAEAIAKLQAKSAKDAKLAELLPDVEIYQRAVHDALKYQEFFAPPEIARGKELLTQGRERAEHLAQGRAPWTTQTGLVVRGYRSKLDGTAQPYGLVVPATFQAASAHQHRLDLWFHGRGETLSEVAFIDQRQKQVGQFAPRDAFVLHPYGRYSNAFKLAGEVDVLESMESVQKRYPIDADRVVVRGFSMGGAGAWHLAVHYPSLWAAANPGAGFSETPDFLKVFQNETLAPSAYEKTLWRLYDCNGYARNLFHCPTVAYSGEIDKQKQAADIMVTAAEQEGLRLTHIIGPQMGHKYDAASVAEVERRLASIVERGRQHLPREVHFVAYTLRYNQCAWATLDALQEHWQKAQIDARIVDDKTIVATTDNITALTLAMPAGWSPLHPFAKIEVKLDSQTLTVSGPESDRSWTQSFHREGETWKVGARPEAGLVKKHLLQGPIDDALMDSFVFVRPTGKAAHDAIGKWSQGELEHAIEHWRRQMRGVARVIDDTQLDDATIASANLVLWGDPSSNAVIRRVLDKLPIRWSAEQLTIGEQQHSAAEHVPLLVYPNPLNPARYVVLNSSFTYREYDYLNNARQVPKLPDWGIVDIRTPANSRFPGKVVAADFFDEQWRVKPGKN